MLHKVDVAVCYHKPSIMFESDALHPMQLGKALAKRDLGIRGDNSGDNISEKNKYYGEVTAFYWLWKNSDADIKGVMHYRRLLDLNVPNGKARGVVLEDIRSPADIVNSLCLNEKRIVELMKDADILISNKEHVQNWFQCTVEKEFKACHIPEHWDWAMDIVKREYPNIYPIAKRCAQQKHAYFTNVCIIKAKLFDEFCEFFFAIAEKIEPMIDMTRPEFVDGYRHTGRFMGFLAERLLSIYIEYLSETGAKIKEFPRINITPKGGRFRDFSNYALDAYSQEKTDLTPDPIFDSNAVVITMVADDKYAANCGVMIRSIIECADLGRNYDIVVCSCGLSPVNARLLQSFSCRNVSIRILDVKDFFQNIDSSVSIVTESFSVEKYCRLFIPVIFKNYAKVLHLDCDMITLRDVADLYDTDMGNKWWAVVRDKFVPVMRQELFITYIEDQLKMASPFDYFNGGVMLWNIYQCIKDKVFERCIERLKAIGNPRYRDQCIMNSVADGKHIFWLSSYWNVPWDISFQWHQAHDHPAYETVTHQLEAPFILHFIAEPSFQYELQHIDKFWKYARKTPFYEDFLLKAMEKRLPVPTSNLKPPVPPPATITVTGQPMKRQKKVFRKKFLAIPYWKKIVYENYRIRKFFLGLPYYNQFDYERFFEDRIKAYLEVLSTKQETFITAKLLDGLSKLEDRNQALARQLDTHTQECIDKLEKLNGQMTESKKFVATYLPRMSLYTGHNGWEHKFMHSFYAALHDEHFERKFQKLTSNLDQESCDAVVRVLNRLLRAETSKEPLSLFTQAEKEQLAALPDEFHSKIIKLTDHKFAYENYFLPINHFESSVFYYRHGLEYVKNIDFVRDKDILDAGGFIGDSALIFSGLTNKKVYSFEAMSSNVALMRQTFELNGISNTVIEHLALGEEPGELELIRWGSCSTIGETTNLNIQNPDKERVRVDTLDNYVAAHNLSVGLIKVDVEGFEQPLLRGAVNTIKTQRPILLISIYHSMDDFFNIKPMIESWNLGYEFKIVKPVDGAVILETMLIAEVARL